MNKSQILDFIAFYKMSQLLWNWGCNKNIMASHFHVIKVNKDRVGHAKKNKTYIVIKI